MPQASRGLDSRCFCSRDSLRSITSLAALRRTTNSGERSKDAEAPVPEKGSYAVAGNGLLCLPSWLGPQGKEQTLAFARMVREATLSK